MKMLNIFLLLPCCKSKVNELMYKHGLMKEDIFEELADRTKLNNFLLEIEQLVNTIGSEKCSELFYSASNIYSFVEGLKILHEKEEEYIAYTEGRLGDILEGFKNIDDKPKKSKDCYYFLWNFDEYEIYPLYDTGLEEIYEQISQNPGDRYLLLNIDFLIIDRNFIPIFKDCKHIDDLPKFINIDFVEGSDYLTKWIERHRLGRIFNLNPKHGENGVGNWDKASPLFCSRREAQALLNTAIYDEKMRNYYNYDQVHNKYIIFEDENTSDNTYHGYHLDKEDDVPYEIRRKLTLMMKQVSE